MDISFINEHTIKPPFVAGNNYVGKIVRVEEKPSGFTLRLEFPELSVPGIWHFNVKLDSSPKAKEIAMDTLKGVIDQIEKPIATTEDLLGETITVRLLSQTDSALPDCALPTAPDVTKLF